MPDLDKEELIKNTFREGKIAGAKSFAKLVKEMRQAQSRYFQTRSKESLKDAKQLEGRVDESLKLILK